jgi:hypothetical protein
VEVGRVQQPALDLALEQLPDRLPIAAGRLHPDPGHPEAGQPLGQQPQPGSGCGEAAGLGLAPTLAIGCPHTGGHRVLVHVQVGATLDQRLHLLASSPRQRAVAIRRSLYLRNLSLVLVATVRGARGSHVRGISGLTAPRERRRRPDNQPILIRRGWPATAMGDLPALEGRPGSPVRAAAGAAGRLGDQAPLVLVVEDLHWADRSTRDLLTFLVRNLRRERVLLVITYRDDEQGQERLGPYLAELDRARRSNASSCVGWTRSRR